MTDLLTTFAAVGGAVLTLGTVWAVLVAGRVKGDYERLKTNLELMSVSNGELRDENDRLRHEVTALQARVDVIQSEIVRNLVGQIAEAAAAAVREAGANFPCPMIELRHGPQA